MKACREAKKKKGYYVLKVRGKEKTVDAVEGEGIEDFEW